MIASSQTHRASGKRPRVIQGVVILLACIVVAASGYFLWNFFQAPGESDGQPLLTDGDSSPNPSKAIYQKITRKRSAEPTENVNPSLDPGEETTPEAPARADSSDRPGREAVAKTGSTRSPSPSSSPSPRKDQEDASPPAAPETGAAPLETAVVDAASKPKAAPSEITSPPPGDEETLRVAVEVGRVREKPSLTAPIAFNLNKGAVVTVEEKENPWLRIDAGNDRSGWAHQDLFEKTGPDEGAGAPMAKEVKKITVESERPDEERIIFALNGKHLPRIFSLEGERPRLVSDFFDARLASDVARNIPVNGAYIQQLRIGIHREKTPKVRVVADLSPGRNYDVKQFFFDESLTFVLVLKSVE